MGKKKQMIAHLGRMLIKDTKRKQPNNETNPIKSIDDNESDNESNECTKSNDETIAEQRLSLTSSTPTTTDASTTCVVNNDNNNLNGHTNIIFDDKVIESNKHLIETQNEELIKPKEDFVCDAFDDAFFNPKLSNSHVKGIHGIKTDNSEQPVGRPPKKHNNRNKREKLRRVYAYLDK